ncbi:7-alpha-hydroxysteroid dehydrogenase [Plesiomonas sp.]|uniref:7-alpha-hydroxysteroid dehydrogenase n=1 Tax=Plesiomonas sp. TaxID=2486279 RepID=UPI003F3AF9AB
MSIEEVFRLDGDVAIITGAGAGIGQAIATVFADAGAAVVISDIDLNTAQCVADEITSTGGKAIAVACDITQESDLNALVEQTVQAFGKITVLVNNAGGGGPKPFDMPMHDFERAYQLNVFPAFRLCQLCAPHMADNGGGSVVNITSMAGENINSNMASYASSKAALNHLTRNIAFDLGAHGIRVNAIAPGAVRTHALSTVLTEDIEYQMLKKTPLGRLGLPSDIAYAALFLASAGAAWVSGQVLTVSGGGSQELE